MELIKCSINYIDNSIDADFAPSIGDYNHNKNSVAQLVRATTDQFVAQSSGLERILKRVLEYDTSAYSVTIAGRPILFDDDEQSNLGYTVVLQIKPVLFTRKPENVRVDFE